MHLYFCWLVLLSVLFSVLCTNKLAGWAFLNLACFHDLGKQHHLRTYVHVLYNTTLSGVIDHGSSKLFFVDLAECGKGANLACSVILNALAMHARKHGYLPPRMYLQTDNTSADFKNSTVFRFLGYLVSRAVFEEVGGWVISLLKLSSNHFRVQFCFKHFRVQFSIIFQSQSWHFRAMLGQSSNVSSMSKATGYVTWKNILKIFSDHVQLYACRTYTFRRRRGFRDDCESLANG